MKRWNSLLIMMAMAICMYVSPVLAQEETSAKGNYYPYNIALGNASVDSKIFDGDENTGWTFTYDTMTIDLGAVYTVERVEIVASGNVAINGWGESQRDKYEPIEGQKAKIICLTDYDFYTSSGKEASTLYEVRVYSRDKKPVNIAIGNTSCGADYAVLFDGNKATSVTFKAGDIVVDLGCVCEISGVNVDVETTTHSVAVSRYSADNTNWVYETPAGGTKARYLVISDYGYYYGGNVYSTVNEIEVYGKKPSVKNIAFGNTSCGEHYAALFDGNKETSVTFDVGDIVVDLGVVYEISAVNVDVKTTASTAGVVASRYSTDNSNWVWEAPTGGAKARYIVISDLGKVYGNVFSTVNEIEVYTENNETVEMSNSLVYDANGGTNPPQDSFLYENEAHVEVLGAGEMDRVGYLFKGWSTTSGGSVDYAAGSCIILMESLTTLYAVWEPLSPLYVTALDYTATDTAVMLNNVTVSKLAEPTESISSVIVYVVVYNRNGILIGASTADITGGIRDAALGADVSAKLGTTVVNLPSAGTDYQIKAFVWNGDLAPHAVPRIF